jgi:hypothetical protein
MGSLYVRCYGEKGQKYTRSSLLYGLVLLWVEDLAHNLRTARGLLLLWVKYLAHNFHAARRHSLIVRRYFLT